MYFFGIFCPKNWFLNQKKTRNILYFSGKKNSVSLILLVQIMGVSKENPDPIMEPKIYI